MKFLCLPLIVGIGALVQAVGAAPALTGAIILLVALFALAVVLEREPALVGRRERSLEVSKDGPGPARALIVGAGEVGRSLARSLEGTGRFHVVGFVDDEVTLTPEDSWMVLGDRGATARIVSDYTIDEVFVAYAPTWQQQLAEDLAAEHPQVCVTVVPTAYEALMRLSKVEAINDIALVKLAGTCNRVQRATKRVFDIVVSACALLATAPVSLMVALLIRLSSRGPVIFAQERVGRYGETFTLYKFRTMRQDAESRTGPVKSSGKEDPRLTWIGRWLRLFRIDEIPQFWNVLRGDMSLVGPRPERPFFVSEYEQMVPTYARRHQVRPGITGLAQVCGGYHTDPRDKLRFDLIYVSHQCLWLDLVILFRTLLVVIKPCR